MARGGSRIIDAIGRALRACTHAVWRFWRWTWRRRGTRSGGVWLLITGMGVGFVVGVAFVNAFGAWERVDTFFSTITETREVVDRVEVPGAERVRVVQSPELRLLRKHDLGMPRPVTPPPPGMAWSRVLTTGYCGCTICCGAYSDGKTAINRDLKVHPFGIAADRRLLPYRTMLEVPGYGYAMVDDTGKAMRDHADLDVVHLDLRFETHDDGRRWGRRWLWLALPLGTPAGARARMVAEGGTPPPLPAKEQVPAAPKTP